MSWVPLLDRPRWAECRGGPRDGDRVCVDGVDRWTWLEPDGTQHSYLSAIEKGEQVLLYIGVTREAGGAST